MHKSQCKTRYLLDADLPSQKFQFEQIDTSELNGILLTYSLIVYIANHTFYVVRITIHTASNTVHIMCREK